MATKEPPGINFLRAVFDMDGTLVDSTALVELEWKQWAATKGLDQQVIAGSAHGRRTEDVIRQYLPDANISEELRLFVEMASTLDQTAVTEIKGAVKFVSSIRNDRWAVVTSAPSIIARRRLMACGFPAPAFVISAEDVTRGKPDPEGYLLAARLFGQDPRDCLVFEDAPAGVEAARRAGMPLVALQTTHPDFKFEGCIVVPDFSYLSVEIVDDDLMALHVAA